MADYNLYPAIDDKYNFPPEVRKAVAKSSEVKTAIDDAVEPKMDKWEASVLLDTKMDSYEARNTFAMPSDVPGLVSDAIAEDSRVAEAAAAAADDAVMSAVGVMDVITGEDGRLLRETSDPEYAIPFTDEDGFIAGGFHDDGSFNAEEGLKVKGALGMVGQPINAPGWIYVESDEDGYVSFGLRDTGEVHMSSANLDPLTIANASIGYTRSNRNRIACFGDSLTNGYFDGSSGKTADAYPTKLQALVPEGVTVFNASTSGWCVDEVAVKIGAIPLPLTSENNTIPASGSVVLSTTADLRGLRPIGSNITFNGSVAGVAGTLVRNTSNSELTFTRKTAGTSVSLRPETVFVPEHSGYDADTSVILLGRNDVSLNIIGGESSVAEHIAMGVKRIVDWHSRQLKQILVLTPTTNTGEKRGSARYQTVVDAGEMMKRLFGAKTYDLRKYLVDQAIYDLKITPNATDLANMDADTLPPSIMDPGDGTHYSRATANLVAVLVNECLTQRDWIG